VRIFDRKFGVDFLAGVPARPGVYRLYDAAGELIYVGKAADLRRRLAQYRAARLTRRDRKRRALVRAAAAIAWEVCESELDAALGEVRLIQTCAPRENVASAFSFLYPFIGIRADGPDVYFCLTTSPEAFPSFALHGAFRSRAVTGEAFFALRRLLSFVGHPVPRARCDRFRAAPHSHVFGLRRLPGDWPPLWDRLLRGASRAALEVLALRLLEHAGARARRGHVHEDLRAVARFARDEAGALARAIAATGHQGYPVGQRDRDPLFLRYRQAGRRPPPKSQRATASA
jgi:excinuclease ABC subunit C